MLEEQSSVVSERSNLIKRIAILLLIAAMLIYSVLSLLRVVSNTLAPSGALDFHSYWYAGHFVRESKDPYEAFFKGLEPSVPVSYLDGVVNRTGPIAQPGLIKTPANTAPIVLLLTPLALFSWPIAKVVWMVLNIAFMLAIPLLVIKLGERYGLALTSTQKIILALAFYGLLASRNAIGNGQTTMLVFLLMLGTLLVSSNPLASGLMLGLALSKYSLALPVAVFLLFKRKFRALIISVGVQVAGVLAVWLISGNSPLLVAQEYIRMASIHIGFEGIQVESMFPPGSIYAILAVGLLSVPLLALLYVYGRGMLRGRFSLAQREATDFTLLSVLSLYLLLAVYHGSYDAVLVILFGALLFHVANSPGLWQLSGGGTKTLFLSALGVGVLLMSVPGSVLLPVFPGWIAVLDSIQTVVVLLMLGVSMWLLYKAMSKQRTEPAIKPTTV